MTRIAVNSTPKSVKGSKRNNLTVDLKNLNQSKVDLNLIDNNIIYEIEEENKNNVVDDIEKELILTPNSLFNNDTDNSRKWSPEDLKDSEVQKSIASNGCIVFFQSKEKDCYDSIALFCPKTYETNSISQFKSFLPVLLSYPGCAKKDNYKYVSEHVKNIVSEISEFDPCFYTGKTYLLSSKMIQDIFVPEHLRKNINKSTLALEEMLFKCNSIWKNRITFK